MYFNQKGEEVSLWDTQRLIQMFPNLSERKYIVWVLCNLSEMKSRAPLHCADYFGWFINGPQRSGWLFLLRFTNIPQRSTDQRPAFWVFSFWMWGAVSLRISVQTDALWGRGDRHQALQASQLIKQSKSALIQCSLMPGIAALVDIKTLLESAFNDYIDTVINSPIYFLFECVFNLFLSVAYHSLPGPESSSHFRNIFVYSAQKEVPAPLLWL